jgi:hypothetical protein
MVDKTTLGWIITGIVAGALILAGVITMIVCTYDSACASSGFTIGTIIVVSLVASVMGTCVIMFCCYTNREN